MTDDLTAAAQDPDEDETEDPAEPGDPSTDNEPEGTPPGDGDDEPGEDEPVEVQP